MTQTMASIAKKFQNKRDLVCLVMGEHLYTEQVKEYQTIIQAIIKEKGFTPVEALAYAVDHYREHAVGNIDNDELMLLCAAIDVSEKKRHERAVQNRKTQMP